MLSAYNDLDMPNDDKKYIDLDKVSSDDQPKGLLTAYDKLASHFEYLDSSSHVNTDILLKTFSTKADFNSETGVLTLDSKEIKFPGDKNQIELLRILFKDKSSARKEWDWVDITRAFGDHDWSKDAKKKRRRVYDTGRNVNTNIAKKTAIEYFLIVTTKTIKVNPKYLE